MKFGQKKIFKTLTICHWMAEIFAMPLISLISLEWLILKWFIILNKKAVKKILLKIWKKMFNNFSSFPKNSFNHFNTCPRPNPNFPSFLSHIFTSTWFFLFFLLPSRALFVVLEIGKQSPLYTSSPCRHSSSIVICRPFLHFTSSMYTFCIAILGMRRWKV